MHHGWRETLTSFLVGAAAIRRSDSLSFATEDEGEMSRFASIPLLLAAVCSVGLGLEASPSAEDRYRQWAEALVPPCCWQGSLKSHDSDAAKQAKLELRAMIRQGRSDQQIRDEFVERYGAAVLMTPDGGRGRWLFTMPVAVLLLSALAAVWALRKMLRAAPRPRLSAAPHVEIDEDELDW